MNNAQLEFTRKELDRAIAEAARLTALGTAEAYAKRQSLLWFIEILDRVVQSHERKAVA